MNIILIIGSCVFLTTLLFGFLELKMLKVKEYTVSSERIPESLSGKKIALISDIHGVSHGKDNNRLFKKLKEAGPDYIFICGDLINGRKDPKLRFAFRFIRRIRKLKVPVFYTFGNHEEKLKNADPNAYKKLVRFSLKRVNLLNNRAYKPDGNDNIAFIGLNLPVWMYHSQDRTGLVKRWTKKIIDKSGSEKAFKILLAHDPEHFKDYAECGIDICFSGHLHGGIVYIPGLGGAVTPRFQFFKKYAKGCHEYDNMKLIVSGGVGWHDLPFRLFNHPEIVLVKLVKRN